MSSNPTIIQINDGIAPSIAPNLRAIETAARSADSSIQTLSQSLNAINATGVGNLSRSISTVNNSTTKLASSTSQMGVAALTASQSIDKLTVSYTNLGAAIQMTAGVIAANANALQNATVKSNTFTQSVRNAGRGAHGQVTDVMAASAAIRGLEGNFGTSVRAAERFLVTTMGLGPILRMAFPVFGALALLGVLDMLVQHVGHLIEAFKRLAGAETDAEVAAIRAGEKILKIKPEGFFTANNMAKLFAGDFSSQDTIQVKNARAQLLSIQRERELATARAETNEKGLQGLALQNAKIEAAKQEQDFLRNSQTAAKNLVDEYDKMLKATHQVTTTYAAGGPTGHATTVTMNLRNITDEKQIKEIESQMKTAQEAADQFAHEINMVGEKINGLRKAEGIVGIKDQWKDAREQMKQFELAMANLKSNAGHVVSPEEKKSLLQQQLAVALPQNVKQLKSEIATLDEQMERQKLTVESLIEKYQDQVDEIGLYRDELREAQTWNKIDLQLKRDGIQLDPKVTANLKEQIKYIAEHTLYQRELKSTYDQFAGPQRNYMAAEEAIKKLEADGAITHNQALIAMNQATLAYNNAINPMFEYSRQLQVEANLTSQYGKELQITTEIERVREGLRTRGRDLSTNEIKQLHDMLKLLYDQQFIQQEVNKLYEEFGGRLDKIVLTQRALNEARQKGVITEERYRLELAKQKVEMAQTQLEMGKFSKGNLATTVFGGYIKEFEGFTKTTNKLYQNMFSQIADGAADALGRAIVFGEDLGAAMKNVAQSALADLISGFIKLGIQMLIQQAIGHSAAASATAAAAATGSAVAASWASAAAFVSLATFGANAGPAMAAIGGTEAFAQMLGLLHFNLGGIVPGGIGDRDTVPAMLTPGEGILNTLAMQRLGRDNFHALNAGAAVVNQNAASKVNLNVSVVHDGSTAVQVQRVNETEYRVIAKQVASEVVRQEAPAAVAAHMHNPNSSVSKAVVRNFNTSPKR